jgi:5-methylthioadenosine/S-adenosylhomocysteine deaminase
VHVETLIHARWVIPVEPAGLVLEEHSVGISKGRIAVIAPQAETRSQITADEVLEMPSHVLIPGLVNAHTHAAMSLFRGLADDLPLMTWLNDHIWPAEGLWVLDEFVADGTRLAVAEMLRGGTTCFNDMYFFPDVTARVVNQVGMRATIGMIIIDFPSKWAQNPDEYFAKASELYDRLKNKPLTRPAFAPHSPYAVCDDSLRRLLRLANELPDMPIHMHVHETHDEVSQGLEQHGVRPIERLDTLGLIGPNLTAVHMTQLEDAEIALMAERGAQVVHCPESNLKLASGFCPVQRLLDAGINVALGTDGAASNNDLDMLGELRTAALLAKGVAGNASALPAAQALEMATLSGARALGLADEIGSLVVGKAADITAFAMDSPETEPVYNLISQIVYAADRHQVSDVWVAGERLLRDRHLTSLDLDQVIGSATLWGNKIKAAKSAQI